MVTVNKIELWKAERDVAVMKSSYGKNEFERKVLIEKDEIVEFRYHAPLHFRTQDNIYCVLDGLEFYSCFRPYGKIFSDVKSANHCELKDIVQHRLYHKWEFIKNWKEFKDDVSLVSNEEKE